MLGGFRTSSGLKLSPPGSRGGYREIRPQLGAAHGLLLRSERFRIWRKEQIQWARLVAAKSAAALMALLRAHRLRQEAIRRPE